MKTCKVNPLKLNKTGFDSKYMRKGRYVKHYFFSNGLGGIVLNHEESCGGNSGHFEIWIIEYKDSTDPWEYEVLRGGHPIHKRHGAVEVIGRLDFGDVDAILKEIRNYNTGEYFYNERTN